MFNREAHGYEVSPILGPHQMDPNRLGVAETWYSNHKEPLVTINHDY
jgi:hypothetical protein